MRTMATSTTAFGTPKIVTVWCLQGDKLDLIFNDFWGARHKLVRCKDEHVSTALKRIELSILKKARKRKSSVNDASLPFEVHLYTPTGDLVSGDVPNQAAWMEQGVLEVGSDRYVVRVDPPTVVSLKLPKYFMTGCPVVPEVRMQLTTYPCYSYKHCKGRWHLSSVMFQNRGQGQHG